MDDEFIKIFESLVKKNEPNTVFNGFLDYTINVFTLNRNVEWNYNFNKKELDQLSLLMIKYMDLMESKLQENRWFDFLGIFYEDIIQTKHKSTNKGQFFTPNSVCDLLTGLSDLKADKVLDSCSGSGRLLLSYHAKNLDALCFAQDLDQQAVKMCTLNFLVHGVVGTVFWMDSLQNEFYGNYRVNKYLKHGVPVPHIEQMKYIDEGFHHIGVKKNESLTVLNKGKSDEQATLEMF